MNKLLEHVTRYLVHGRVAAADQPRMEPRISTLRADGGAIVGAICGYQPREVIIEPPAPLIRSGIEDPSAASGLIDGHGPVGPRSKHEPFWKWIATSLVP